MRIASVFCTLLVSAFLFACGPKGDVKAGGPSLYDKLGGKNAIEAVVGDFLDNVKADQRISAKFANAKADDLKTKLVDQICQAAGGPCTYTGKNMKDAHKGMGVTEAEFNALVEDLVKSLDKFKVGESEKNALLGVLGPMKSDIVESPGQP